MDKVCYTIAGGDYDSGGSASRQLKETLKHLGVDPASIRRAMIAAYESEMNVVIHATRGRMEVTFHPQRIDVVVEDEGPGIQNLEQALQEGFSTAPPKARDLGFGAGMGLPNIKKNSNRFDITSEVGRGTRVSFSIDIQSQKDTVRPQVSLRIDLELCTGCRHCLWVCPTRALRVRGPKQVGLLTHLCIECTTCIGECPTGALKLPEANDKALANTNEILILPDPLLAQFGALHSPEQIHAAIKTLGFTDVVALTNLETLLVKALLERAATDAVRPVISPVCPAVVQLIESRFPALLPNIAPLYSAPEAALRQHAGRAVALIVLCPAQRSAAAILSGQKGLRFMTPGSLRSVVSDALAREKRKKKSADASKSVSAPAMPSDRNGSSTLEGFLQVTGIRHVLEILEEVENGLVRDVAVLELYACDQGCLGSSLLWENPFVAEYRRQRLPETKTITSEIKTADLARSKGFRPRPGIRVDPHLPTAMLKLGEISRLTRRLPGTDCGLCGSPSCAAFAEDVVLRRCEASACSERSAREEKQS
jgi:anti-sigma regulatory factor (Ser/Thr protein kinase)/iron only hydrogenase large subunit-like protein